MHRIDAGGSARRDDSSWLWSIIALCALAAAAVGGFAAGPAGIVLAVPVAVLLYVLNADIR